MSEDFKDDCLKLQYSNLITAPDYAEGEGFAKKGEIFLSEGEEVLPIWAPAFTLSKVLSDYRVSHTDFLSIDVEGGELGVLNGFPRETVRAKLILIESARGSTACRFLEKKGYFHEVDLLNNHFYSWRENLTNLSPGVEND